MLKYLVFLAFLVLFPETSRAQSRYAVVDYSGLTDSLYERFEGWALMDSIRNYHISRGQKKVDYLLWYAKGCHLGATVAAQQQKIERLHNEIEDYRDKVILTAIPALDTELCAYLNNLALRVIRNRQENQPGLKLFDKSTVLYARPDTPDLTQELLTYIESQRGNRKRFALYAASRVISLGLNVR